MLTGALMVMAGGFLGEPLVAGLATLPAAGCLLVAGEAICDRRVLGGGARRQGHRAASDGGDLTALATEVRAAGSSLGYVSCSATDILAALPSWNGLTVLLARSSAGAASWVMAGSPSSCRPKAGRPGTLAMGVQVTDVGVTNADAGSTEENACVVKGGMR